MVEEGAAVVVEVMMMGMMVEGAVGVVRMMIMCGDPLMMRSFRTLTHPSAMTSQ